MRLDIYFGNDKKERFAEDRTRVRLHQDILFNIRSLNRRCIRRNCSNLDAGCHILQFIVTEESYGGGASKFA